MTEFSSFLGIISGMNSEPSLSLKSMTTLLISTNLTKINRDKDATSRLKSRNKVSTHCKSTKLLNVPSRTNDNKATITPVQQ